MKKLFFLSLALSVIGMGALAFGGMEGYRGGRDIHSEPYTYGTFYRINKFDPNNPYWTPEERKAQEKSPMERDYLTHTYGVLGGRGNYEQNYYTRPYVLDRRWADDQDYYYNPYGTLPRRWYDDYDLRYQGGGGGPAMLTSPYDETSPLRDRPVQSPVSGRVPEREYFTHSYGIDYQGQPRAHSNSQHKEKTTKTPLGASPLIGKKPYSSQVLTSPFEEAPERYPIRPTTSSELTPPGSKGYELI